MNRCRSATPLSVGEFAPLVKTKYPEVATTSDDVLVANVLEKWPAYRAHVDAGAIAEASLRFDMQVAAQQRVTTITRTIATTALSIDHFNHDHGGDQTSA